MQKCETMPSLINEKKLENFDLILDDTWDFGDEDWSKKIFQIKEKLKSKSLKFNEKKFSTNTFRNLVDVE